MSIGEYLKKHRVKKNLSIESVSNLTRIPKYHLENLEQEKFESLPHKTFVQGHLKTLSKFLSYDSNIALSLFNEAHDEFQSNFEPLKYKRIIIASPKNYIFRKYKQKTFIDYIISNVFMKSILSLIGLIFLLSLIKLFKEF